MEEESKEMTQRTLTGPDPGRSEGQFISKGFQMPPCQVINMASGSALDAAHGEVQETVAVATSSEQREGRDGERGSRRQPEGGLPVPRACGQSSREAPAGTTGVETEPLALHGLPESVSRVHASLAL